MSACILIVDDDADSRALLRTAVVQAGYAPLVAADGAEALALIATQPVDIVLLDAVMPGLDGFETCRRMKANPVSAPAPVIFMTGLSEPEHVLRGLEAGGVDYVTKPLMLDVLLARIAVHLRNARTTRGALEALDSLGGLLLTCDDKGDLRWATPAARQLLESLDTESRLLLGAALVHGIGAGEPGLIDVPPRRITLAYLGARAPGEHLFSLTRSVEGMEAVALQQAYGLTPREADVLLWTARGKSNKDMSEILNISARTVNKHLEQIFIKMGVENRASAASAATRTLMGG